MTDDRKERPNRIPWPPLIVAAAILLAWLLDALLPVRFDPGLLRWAGYAMLALAIAIDVTAMVTMARAKTTIMPHQHSDNLVTHGIFSMSRNPIYVANILIIAGLGLMTGNAWYFSTAIGAFHAIRHLAIEREELHLEANFGETYRRYKGRTRRWI